MKIIIGDSLPNNLKIDIRRNLIGLTARDLQKRHPICLTHAWQDSLHLLLDHHHKIALISRSYLVGAEKPGF